MGIDGRRSARMPMQIPVEISYVDQQGQARLERTKTLSIDRHGARIASQSSHPTGTMINMGVPHLGRSSHCRVVWCSASVGGAFELGLEIQSDDDLWGVPFPQPPSQQPVASQLEAAQTSAVVIAILVQLLQEKGVLRPGELESRVRGQGRY